MATWRTDSRATHAAREAFPEHAPRVFRYGDGQFLLTPTPFGRMELIAVREGYLVAVEHLPDGDDAASREAPPLPEPLARHLSANGLRVWKTVPSREPAEVIRSLGAGGTAPPKPQADGRGGVWSPLLLPLAAPGRAVGEVRQARAQAVASLLAARGPGDPLPGLVGPEGVGKRTLLAGLAAEHGWAAIELPLRRVFLERVFQTPIECFLELLLAAAGRLGEKDLLVVSDAEMLAGAPEPRQRHIVAELSLLPRVCLAARPVGAPPPYGVVAMSCPGLDGPEEVAALLAAELPDVRFEGAGLGLLARAASLPGAGVVPGRLLYLVRLAVALFEGEEGAPVVLAPDEAARVIGLARSAWDACDAEEGSATAPSF